MMCQLALPMVKGRVAFSARLLGIGTLPLHRNAMSGCFGFREYHTAFIVTGLVQFFFQPSFFLRRNRGSPGLAATAGCCGFCVQMGITSLQFGYKKAPPSRAVQWQSLEMVLPEITYIFSDALINFLQWILFDLE